ncbi:excalibur calcium-binding domain-containing protein [Paraglaciecola sp. 20A4]|uniref:excalibur calcium-binding domain-containing protein n=1 Tax=Paraglaciecola sp. 20A4 TaxID=2687288 RepID=UPI00140BFC0C|nr:excalibur calcium-binding domain-containing protein [Paraglaciecola sp. 20A4]
MKKLIVLALLFFATIQIIPTLNAQSNQGDLLTQSAQQMIQTKNPAQSVNKPARKSAPMIMNFRCDGRQYCSQMTSRAEAEYFLQHCPDTRMDGDNDGIPCENDSRF